MTRMLDNHNGFKFSKSSLKMITYNDLYETLRKERYSEQLQPLSKKFISDVSNYIAEKKKLANQGGDFFSDEVAKVKKQLENANSIFKELMLMRKKKLLGLVFVASETGINKRDFENMLDFEKKMFDDMVKCVESTESQVSMLLNAKSENNVKQGIVFREDTGEFMDLNGEMLGPFKKGDKTELQKDIVKILVEDGKAEMVL